MSFKLEIFSSSIVVLGNFNPIIISPDWLVENNLIGKGDADSIRNEYSESLVISTQVTFFETKWFALQVLKDRFSLTSKDALSPAFKDLAAGIFQLLSHTPVNAVGINFMGHFRLENRDIYHSIGDKLAPKIFWDGIFKDHDNGLLELTIQFKRGPRNEFLNIKDEIRVTIQPSKVVTTGIFLAYNKHVDLTNTEEFSRPAEMLCNVLDRDWENSWEESNRAFHELLENALNMDT